MSSHSVAESSILTQNIVDKTQVTKELFKYNEFQLIRFGFHFHFRFQQLTKNECWPL